MLVSSQPGPLAICLLICGLMVRIRSTWGCRSRRPAWSITRRSRPTYRRALWDISQPVDQRSKETRKRLWEEVADELNGVLDAITVKQKFKSLRNTYRKIVQSEQYLPSGSGRNKNEGRHKWKHYDRMEFLRDTSLSKDTSSNISSTKNELLNKSVDQSTSQVQNPIDIDPNDSSSTESETETPTLSSTFTSGKKPKTQYQFYY
ncbi:uncharacterized protein [Temnothorax longispinosus]|uniref:uncharacterized protein isoform X4 n=1 Tax=Temnothorax longispinosus TaxID=300112 RepID=UPI003A99477D